MNPEKLEPIAAELNNLMRHSKDLAAAEGWTNREMVSLSPGEAILICQRRLKESAERLRKLGFVAPGGRPLPRA